MAKRSTAILLAALTVTAATLGAAAPTALAGSRDNAATLAYIRANYTLIHAARANLASGRAALGELTRQTTSQCPMAATGSPENHDSEQLSNEVAGALLISVYRFDTPAIREFAGAVGHLYWSNPRLTHSVKTYVTKLEGISTLAEPNICADVQAWVADGYQALPVSAASFDQSYYAVNVEAEEVPLHLLAPYEDHAGAVLLRRTKQLEAPLAEVEAHAVKNYTDILDGLGLNQ